MYGLEVVGPSTLYGLRQKNDIAELHTGYTDAAYSVLLHRIVFSGSFSIAFLQKLDLIRCKDFLHPLLQITCGYECRIAAFGKTCQIAFGIAIENSSLRHDDLFESCFIGG